MAPVVGQKQQFNALDQNGTTMHAKRQTHVPWKMGAHIRVGLHRLNSLKVAHCE